MNTDKKVERIMEAILFHLNGYSREEAKRLAGDNKSHPLWEEIESILKGKPAEIS